MKAAELQQMAALAATILLAFAAASGACSANLPFERTSLMYGTGWHRNDTLVHPGPPIPAAVGGRVAVSPAPPSRRPAAPPPKLRAAMPSRLAPPVMQRSAQGSPRPPAATGRQATRPPPARAPVRCPDLPAASFAAVDALLASGPGVPYADLLWGVRFFRLEGETREAMSGGLANVSAGSPLPPERAIRQARACAAARYPRLHAFELLNLLEEGMPRIQSPLNLRLASSSLMPHRRRAAPRLPGARPGAAHGRADGAALCAAGAVPGPQRDPACGRQAAAAHGVDRAGREAGEHAGNGLIRGPIWGGGHAWA